MEMTQEEKAIAYDKALERAKDCHIDGLALHTPVKEVLEHIFPELAESEDEKIRKEIISIVKSYRECCTTEGNHRFDDCIVWLEKQEEPSDKGEISDGYHTFNELYYYRMLYNAAFFNMLPKEWVHKSKKHNDGEECFGGGWFIVMANLPTGQISNHYELKDWDLFNIPEKEIANKWDGHTPQEAANRLHKYLLEKQCEKFVEPYNNEVKLLFIKALERVEELSAKGYKLTDCDKNSLWEDFKAYSEQILTNSKNQVIMTQEEKQLLMKDLCARLRYGVICCVTHKKNGSLVKEDMKLSGIFEDGNFYFLNGMGSTYSDNYIPYLRPMSSMTEEEKEGYNNARSDYYDDLETYDWLNEHHFDYRGLIEKGLAIEAPENMYNN